MTGNLKYLLSGFLSLCITAFLFSLLLFVGTDSKKQERILKYGAMRLSTFDNESMDEKEDTTAETTPVVQAMKDLTMAEITMETPEMDMSISDVSIDFSTALVGTTPLGAMPGMASPMPSSGLSGGALSLGEVDEKPRAIFAPPPLYPGGQRGNHRVYVRITIFEDGTVQKAEPLTNSKFKKVFADSAADVVKTWRFTPCKKGGKAVRCIADQPFLFTQKR